jgi:hypothetical protein
LWQWPEYFRQIRRFRLRRRRPRSVAASHEPRRAADPTARYYRFIILVHLTGSGKHTDPIRPEYVPSAVDAARQGILSWSFQVTDDKNMAIVHLVASNRHAFDAILADTRPDVRVFEIGKDSRAAIEAEMSKHKKGFDLSQFAVVAR